MNSVTTCREDASQKFSDDFLIAFVVDPVIDAKPYSHVYEGKNVNDHWTWLTRCSLNINIYQLAAVNSALLKNEYIDSVLEYQ